MGFDAEYERFILEQTEGMGKEEKECFHKRHGHASRLFLEQVWWPAFGHFDYLYAEYEVEDFKDGTRYLDFAYIRDPYRVNIEIDGYHPHQRDVSRWQFSDHLNRQNHMVLDGWKVYRFSYDDIKDSPRRCQQFLQQMLGKYYGNGPLPELSMKEREILRLALLSKGPIRPVDMKKHLQVGKLQIRSILAGLMVKGLLQSCSEGTRINRYMITPTWRGLLQDIK
ncbi:DNA-binding response regulator [Gorillibacterium sp. sgz5001074]|uniref:DNA-binding response regulator n=1 Tax=Gorillibacterium sp. sgz5001074 TaxID=3446695 RepID=UPI003F669DD3